MRLSYSPLYYGIRLAYQRLVNPVYKVVTSGVPIIFLSTSMMSTANADTKAVAPIIIDGIAFSENGFDFEQLENNASFGIADNATIDSAVTNKDDTEYLITASSDNRQEQTPPVLSSHNAINSNNTKSDDIHTGDIHSDDVYDKPVDNNTDDITIKNKTENSVESFLENDIQDDINLNHDSTSYANSVTDIATDTMAIDTNVSDTNVDRSIIASVNNVGASSLEVDSIINTDGGNAFVIPDEYNKSIFDNHVNDSYVNNSINSYTHAMNRTTTAPRVTTLKPVNTNPISVQQSLERLAEFYQLNQSDLSKTDTKEEDILQADSIAPVIKPDLFNRNTVPYRCEGVWINPSNRSNYQNALYGQSGTTAPTTKAPLNNSDPLDTRMAMYAESDYAYYDNDNIVELAGDVKVVQGGRLIESERVVMDLKQGITGAQGQVLFTDSAINATNTTSQPLGNEPSHINNNIKSNVNVNANEDTNNDDAKNESGLIGVADQLAYNGKSGQATAYDVAFASIPMQAHGHAAKLNRPSDSKLELDDVMFTTCPPTDRKWRIQAKQIDLDTDSGRAEAYDATFRLGDVPILYLPYFNFPIDSRRSSGFLVPGASIDSDNGLRVSVPYYFNLAPNYDSTLTTQIFSNRNPMLTGEFRYLTEYGEGGLTATYLANDKQYDYEDRNAVFYEHHWQSEDIEHLTADAVYNYVSDPDYVSDFDRFGTLDNDLNLPRRAQVNYYNDYLTGQFKVETFQTLDAKDVDGNPVLDKDKPYSRLPQLSLEYRLPWVEGVDIAGIHDSAYFKKSINDGSENEKSGVRVYNELSASLPVEASWGYVTPQAKLQHLFTAYDEESRLDNNLSENDSSNGVFVPQFSVDAGLNLYQAGSPLGWFDDTMGGYQLLSPRVKYIYAPYKSQNDIPNFNTRVASINYEQLFEDSWLLGYDRISDNHAVTPGVAYRYIDAMGVTRFDANIAKQFILDNGQVTLDDGEPLLSDDTIGAVWSSSAQPYRNLWFDFNGALQSNNDINFLTAGIRYQPTKNSLLNLGYVKRTQYDDTNQLPLTAWTGSALFPINDRTRLLAQAQYDPKNDKVIDSLLGIDYEDCCYGFSVYGRQYYNDLNLNEDPNRAVMFEFRINGMGTQSSRRLNRLATKKIAGFEEVNNNWRY